MAFTLEIFNFMKYTSYCNYLWIINCDDQLYFRLDHVASFTENRCVSRWWNNSWNDSCKLKLQNRLPILAKILHNRKMHSYAVTQSVHSSSTYFPWSTWIYKSSCAPNRSTRAKPVLTLQAPFTIKPLFMFVFLFQHESCPTVLWPLLHVHNLILYSKICV